MLRRASSPPGPSPRSLWPGLVAMIACSLVAPAAGAQDADRLAASLGDGIRTGEDEQEGTSVAWGTATAVVEAPIDDVLRVVRDYAHYSEFLPHFRTSRVLARRGDDAMVYMEVGILRDTVTLWGNLRIRYRAREQGGHVVEARMTEGNMDEFRARWELAPLANGHTLVQFRILVDPDLPVPSSVVSSENVKSARRTIRRLRDRVQRD